MGGKHFYRRSIFLLVATLCACGGSDQSKQNQSGVSHPTKVTVIAVTPTLTIGFERVPGSVKAKTDATIEAKVTGKISKLLVHEGEIVKEGQSLIEIDAPEIQARLDQAKASLKQAIQDRNRFSLLLSNRAVPQQDFETAETRVRVGTANVAEAEAMVSYTRIKAPFEGIVTEKQIDQGDLAVPGKVLLKVERQDLYRFEADVPETLGVGLLEHSNIIVHLSGTDRQATGQISEISPTTDSNSRTLRIKIDLPADLPVRSGQFGYALIPTKSHNAIVIPENAVIQRGQIEIVFVADKGHALLRLVTSGKRTNGSIEILSGLDDGDKIIDSNSSQLTDGDAIEITRGN